MELDRRTERDSHSIRSNAAGSGLKNLPNIEALIEYDGQINIGYHQPIGCIAVANDESNTLAMLKRRPKEFLEELLSRLDTGIEHAIENEIFVDEVNPL